MSTNVLATELRRAATLLDEEENRYGGDRENSTAKVYRKAADEIDRLAAPATPLPLYAWQMSAQQWDRDPYYVASSFPVHRVVVVASTKDEAVKETLRLVGEPQSGRYWRTWTGKAKDIRLMTDTEKAAL